MDKADKIAVGITLGAVLSFILVVGFRLFESQQPPEKPKYEIGECYIVDDNWFKIKVTGDFGAIVEDFRYQRKFYITFDELKKDKQFDCDLVEIMAKGG